LPTSVKALSRTLSALRWVATPFLATLLAVLSYDVRRVVSDATVSFISQALNEFIAPEKMVKTMDELQKKV
jgi:hypothetical protein